MSIASASSAACLPTTPEAVVADSSMLKDIAMLMRPRIAVMVLATVATGMWLTAPGPLPGGSLALVLVGTALVAASSSITNQILERDLDRLMRRTAGRPLASGRLAVATAASLAAATLVAGAGLLGIVSLSAAAAAVATWLIYVVAYTPLKRRTPLNTAVGAISGAMPVAIGWLAAGGPERIAEGRLEGSLAAAALATALYLWQFPHFMAIAWLYRHQYAMAGMRMLPVEDPSGLRAGGQAIAAALAMVPVSLFLAVPSGSPRLFIAEAFASGLYVVASAHFAICRDDRSARRLLLASLGTLVAVMTAVVTLGGNVRL
jgi:protoheme IX farnesyltransferase